MQIIRVFLASPGDTVDERRIVGEVIADINRHHGRGSNFRVDLLLWEEDSYPAVGIDAQDVINRQIGDYDIFVGIMSTKFGSPTTRANSGTEEEFDRAFQKLVTNPGSIKILFYFRNATLRLLQADLYQALQVQRFRDRIGALGVLYHIYEDSADFRRDFGNHLLQVIRELIAEPSGSAQSLVPPAVPSHVMDLPDWYGTVNKAYPQWASYRDVPLEKYSHDSYRLSGSLKPLTQYFRFGFKLLTTRGNLFGDGTVQSKDANLLVHLGRNSDSNNVFLTTYYNGLRQGPNKPILDYTEPKDIPIEVSVG